MADFIDLAGKRRQLSLGHCDRRKAEMQQREKEANLRAGIVEPESMKLSRLSADYQARTRGQIRQSSLREADIAMRELVTIVGDIDCRNVAYKHGERFLQACLDKGNAVATGNKKVRTLKRIFEVAVLRGLLETNPWRRLRGGKVPQQEIHVYTEDECHRLIKAAREFNDPDGVNWQLLIALALSTGARRGELLNLVWPDVDFERQVVKIAPKPDGDRTWLWFIKDAERRTLPLTDEVLAMLLEQHERQPEGSVYVLVPYDRYRFIQQRRKEGRWSEEDGRCPLDNFTRRFGQILRRAAIERGTFHDLRRTCLSCWLSSGLTEYDVMKLAGHSDFGTTNKFYLQVRHDLVERAREASIGFVARPLRATTRGDKNRVFERGRRVSNPQPSDRQSDALTN